MADDHAQQLGALQTLMQQLIEVQLRQVQQQPASTTTSPASQTNDPTLVTSISTRLPTFIYQPDDGLTYSDYYARNEFIITPYLSQLDDKVIVSILLQKLTQTDYNFFIDRILPKSPKDYDVEGLVKELKSVFKSNKSVFIKRFDLLRTEYDGSGLANYTGTLLRRFTNSDFKSMSDDAIQCIIWISGLRDPQYDDLRTKALQIMDSRPNITVRDLEAEIQRLLSIRDDAKKIRYTDRSFSNGSANIINAVTSNASNKQAEPSSNTSSSRPPPSPCFKCGDNHWANTCNKLVICNSCGRKGHMEKFCRQADRSADSKSTPASTRSSRHTVKRVTIASNTSSSCSKGNRLFRHVIINGYHVNMQLDTGADISLLSIADWERMHKPSLLPPSVSVRSANDSNVSVKGRLQCTFSLNGLDKKGHIHVADTESLLGLDWIHAANLLNPQDFTDTRDSASSSSSSSRRINRNVYQVSSSTGLVWMRSTTQLRHLHTSDAAPDTPATDSSIAKPHHTIRQHHDNYVKQHHNTQHRDNNYAKLNDKHIGHRNYNLLASSTQPAEAPLHRWNRAPLEVVRHHDSKKSHRI